MVDADRGSAAVRRHLDRARVYRGLARLFAPPDAAAIEALRRLELPELREALERLGADAALRDAGERVAARLAAASAEDLRSGYERTFEPSGGLRCSPHETFHTTDIPQKQLTRTFDLADIAGFYRAFGLEPTPGTERPDHVRTELEFMQVLAVKEAVAREAEGEGERVEVCRDAARSFLRDHLARWVPRFAARLEQAAADPLYAAAGRLLDGAVGLDAARLGV